MNENQNGKFIMIRSPLPKGYISAKPSKMEALVLVQNDFYFRHSVSVLKYSIAWNWHRNTVDKFLKDNFLTIKRANSRQEGILELTPEGIALGDKCPIVNARINVHSKPN